MLEFLNKILNFKKAQCKDLSLQKHDFSFGSGERQTGKSLAEIRYDHRVRYNLPIHYLKQNVVQTERLFGLDMFSGNGYGTFMVSEKLDCFVLGIEGSEEAVAFANEHYSGKKTLFSHKCFPFALPPEAFDFIVCMESLEHVEDSLLMIEQLQRSLKGDGYLFLSTPNERCLPYSTNLSHFHYRHFTKEEIIEIVERKYGMKMLSWYGQDMYKMSEGKISGDLSDDEMEIFEEDERQVLIFIFKKNMRDDKCGK